MLWTNTEITTRYYIFRSFVFLRLFPSLQLASYCFSKIVEWSLSLANFRNEMKFKKIVKGELFREGNSPMPSRKNRSKIWLKIRRRGVILFDESVGICSKGGKNMVDGGWSYGKRKNCEKLLVSFLKKKGKKKKEIDELRRKFLETMFLQWIDWIGVIW